MAGLTIVGLGPARPEHLTREAMQVLEGALHTGARVYGLAHVRELVADLVPALQVRSLDYLYAMDGIPRPVVYRDLADMLVRRAFEDEQDVIYVVAGSPLFINDAVLWIRRTCADAGHPLRLVHGMSFLDLILDRVYWTGHQGLQFMSAWNVAQDGMDPDTRSPTVICQLGESSSGGDAVDAGSSTAMLAALRDRLLSVYPGDHPVIILYSSGRPDYRSLARQVPLSVLADEPVPVYSNLWVPALEGPEIERLLAPGDPS